jgi:eukaryotic-like serine/threonine-protein kinase
VSLHCRPVNSSSRDQIPATVPTSLGDFAVTGILGEGGSGVVYDARWGHRQVALKVLRPPLVATRSERERFFAEARLLAEIAHPGVVKVLGVGELPDGRPYLAMEKLHGETLARRLGRGAIPVGEALDLFAQIARAVEALHGRGLVHRDLKPENVVLVAGDGGAAGRGGGEGGGAGFAVLLDFGIAKELSAPASTVTQDGGVRGTPAYMAPERFFGQPASVSTDVYELALILYAMLAGRLPWGDFADPEARLNPTPLGQLGIAVPPAVDAELGRALSTRAANRPATVADLLARVTAASGGLLGAAPGRRTVDLRGGGGGERAENLAPIPQDPALAHTALAATEPSGVAVRRPRGRRLAVAAGIGLVAAGGTAAALLLRTGEPDAGAGPSGSPAGAVAATPASAAPGAPGGSPWSAAPLSDSAATAAATAMVGGEAAATGAASREIRREALADAARHLPADSAFVFGLAFRDAREDAAIGKVVQSALDNSPYLNELRLLGTACQIDITDSIDWLAVGLLPPPAPKRGRPPVAKVGPGNDQLDIIAAGTWSRDRVEQCILRIAGGPDKLVVDRDGPVTRIGAPRAPAEIPAEATASGRAKPPARAKRPAEIPAKIPDRWLGWIDDRTFLMSTRPTADAAWIRARLAGDSDSAAAGTTGIAPQLAAVDRRSALWFAGDGEQILGEPLIAGAPRARALFGRIDLGSELRFDITLRYAADGDAGKVKALLDQRLAELAEGQDLSMFGRFEVAQQGGDVHLGAQLTGFATLMLGSALDSALAEAPKPTPKP